MECYAVFKIGDQEIKVKLEGQFNSLEEVSTQQLYNTLISDKDSLKKIIEQISIVMDENSSFTSDMKTITKKKGSIHGVFANTTFGQMADTYSFQRDNKNEFADTKILYVQSMEVEGKMMSGRIIGDNSEEVFILTGNPINELRRLQTFLKLRKKIQDTDTSDKLLLGTEDIRLLNKIVKEKKSDTNGITDWKSLLQYFIENKDEFNKIRINIVRRTKNTQSVWVSARLILDDILQAITFYSPLDDKYKSQIANVIAERRWNKPLKLRSDNGEKYWTRNHFITADHLYDLLYEVFYNDNEGNVLLFQKLKIRQKHAKKQNGLIEFEEFGNKQFSDLNESQKKIINQLAQYIGFEIKDTDIMWGVLWNILTYGDPTYKFHFVGTKKYYDKIKQGGRELYVSSGSNLNKGDLLIELKYDFPYAAEFYEDIGYDTDTIKNLVSNNTISKQNEFVSKDKKLVSKVINNVTINNGYYKGYHIYEKRIEEVDPNTNVKNTRSVFYISRGVLNEVSPSNEYEYLKDAIDYIDQRNAKRTFDRDMRQFKLSEDAKAQRRYNIVNESIGNFGINEIIMQIDIPINTNSQLNANEAELYNINHGQKTIADFYNIVDKWNISDDLKNNIKTNIDTVEKATIFLYKLTEQKGLSRDNTVENNIKQIINDINDQNNLKYFQIMSRRQGIYGWNYQIVPVNVDEYIKIRGNTEDNLNDVRAPILQTMTSLATVMKNSYNLDVVIESADNLQTELKKLKKLNANVIAEMVQHKAFIYDGKIYVNSNKATVNDLMHEYMHLVLGVLKNINLDGYQKLMERTMELAKKETFESYQKRYEGLSMYDIAEEYFCNNISYYLTNNYVNMENGKKLFNSPELKEVTQILFSTEIANEEDLKTLYSGNMARVFSTFNKQMQLYLQQNKSISFSSTNQTRKITNWIGQQIQLNKKDKNKGIEEECK